MSNKMPHAATGRENGAAVVRTLVLLAALRSSGNGNLIGGRTVGPGPSSVRSPPSRASRLSDDYHDHVSSPPPSFPLGSVTKCFFLSLLSCSCCTPYKRTAISPWCAVRCSTVVIVPLISAPSKYPVICSECATSDDPAGVRVGIDFASFPPSWRPTVETGW